MESVVNFWPNYLATDKRWDKNPKHHFFFKRKNSVILFLSVALANVSHLFTGLGDSPNTMVSYESFQRISKQILRETNRERRLKRVFQEFDAEKKGFIEAQGIKRVLRRLHIDYTESDIDLMIKMADTKGDGRVDFEEFLQIFNESDDV